MCNGILVGCVGIQPIIATLILMVAGRGVAMLLTGGQIITFENPRCRLPGQRTFPRPALHGDHRARAF